MAFEVRKTREFASWIDALADVAGRARVLVQVDRLAAGNPGHVKAVGSGVSELRLIVDRDIASTFCDSDAR